MERRISTGAWVWVGKQRSCKPVALDCPVLEAMLCKQRADMRLLLQHPSHTPIAHQLGPVASRGASPTGQGGPCTLSGPYDA